MVQLNKCVVIAEELKKHAADITFKQKDKNSSAVKNIKEVLFCCRSDSLNDMVDTKIRYVEFWLAVHYYECMWLESKKLTEK